MVSEKIEKKQDLSKWISSGLLIGFFTAFSYAATFAYEAGFAYYFGIPWQLISISITTILIAIGIMLVFFVFIFIACNFIWLFVPKGNDVLSIMIRRFVVLAIACLIIFIPRLNHLSSWLVLLMFLLIYAFLEFARPAFTRKGETYIQKLQAHEDFENEAAADFYSNIFAFKLGYWPPTILYYIFIILYCSYGLGRQNAEIQREFFVCKYNDQAILCIYGDLIVSSEFDRGQKKLIGPLTITKLDKTSEIVLAKESIGPLKVEERK